MQNLILKAREERWYKRISLVKKYDKPLVTITLNIPGEVKNNKMIEKVFLEICKNFNDKLLDNDIDILYHEEKTTWDGPEAYIVVNNSANLIKKIAIEFEKNHKLGRIADIDVMNKKGKDIGRQDVGFKRRRCYLCDNLAHYCVVNRTHKKEEIIKKIHTIISEYFEGVKC